MESLLLCLPGAEGPLFWGVGLAHSEGQLETARLGLGGPYLPFGGPERLVVSVGQSIGCLGHVRLCIDQNHKPIPSEWA